MSEKIKETPAAPESGSVFDEILSEAGIDSAERQKSSDEIRSGSGYEELTEELYRIFGNDKQVSPADTDGSDKTEQKNAALKTDRPTSETSENIDVKENTEDSEQSEPPAPQISVSVTRQKLDAAAVTAKRGMRSVGRKIKNSETLKPEVIKDMFFGGSQSESEIRGADEKNVFDDNETEEYDDRQLFGKKKRHDSDPRGNKMFFRIMYMLTPEQVTDGYMLFYNEFVKKRNIRFTLVLSMLSVIFLVTILMIPDSMLSYLLLLVCAAAVVMRWVNSISARRESIAAADGVVNSSYKLSFYNSRIIIESSESDEDVEHSYPPVVIRFEDIDLKLLDYDEIYVLIFRKNYLYVIPKASLDEAQNELFREHLKNILGDDFYVFEKRGDLREYNDDISENENDTEDNDSSADNDEDK